MMWAQVQYKFCGGVFYEVIFCKNYHDITIEVIFEGHLPILFGMVFLVVSTKFTNNIIFLCTSQVQAAIG